MKTSYAISFLVLLFLTPLAYSQTAPKWNERDLTWAAPLTCEDGSPPAQCPVTGYRLESAATCTATTWNLLALVPATPLTYRATNLVAGSYCFRVKATSAAGDSKASITTPSSQATVIAPLPGTPGAVVTSAATAYEMRTGTNPLALVGLVPKGAVCGPATKTINGVLYCEVAKAQVDVVVWPANLAVTQLWARAVPAP